MGRGDVHSWPRKVFIQMGPNLGHVPSSPHSLSLPSLSSSPSPAPFLLPSPSRPSPFVCLARCARLFLICGALRAPMVSVLARFARQFQQCALLPLATEGLPLLAGKVFIQMGSKPLSPEFEKCSFRWGVHSDGVFIQMGRGFTVFGHLDIWACGHLDV